jgi:hypothetical protein
MKPKLMVGVLLASALMAFLWWRFQRAALPKVSAPAAIHPGMASASAPVNANLSSPAAAAITVKKMTMVTPGPATTPVSLHDQTPNWSAVQGIINPRATYEARSSAIAALSLHLTDLDWEALQKFLLRPDPSDQNQQMQAIKNQLMDVLCAMNPPPAGLGDALTRIYHDHQQDNVIRDYAVQHLAAYYEQMAEQANSAESLQSIQQVLWEALNEQGGSIGGTALLALRRLSQEYATGFDQKRIASSALQMAADNYSGELTHITAYQVCAQMKVANALPILAKAAETGESITVRMSAIGSLGLLGGTDQISDLEKIMNGAEDRLKPAARHALEQIKARNNNRLASQN